MYKTGLLLSAVAAMASSPAFADTHYMVCHGGGRAGLYYSGVFPGPQSTNLNGKAKEFSAFVNAKYHATILSECSMDQTQALAASSKKIREDSDQTSKFPSKLIETGWLGK